MLGVGRTFVTRTIRHFREDGLVATRRGVFVIRDEPGLRRLTCGCTAARQASNSRSRGVGGVRHLWKLISSCLAPGGHFLFTVESKSGEGWEQTITNRFRHSEAYLHEQASQAGFKLVLLFECTLRYEAGAPVAGLAVALQKPVGH